MDDKSFATRLVKLKETYQSLLAEHGLDKIRHPEEKARESFDAMFDAGWWSDKSANREEAWSAYKSKRENTRGYQPLMERLSDEVEEAIRLRNSQLPCPVHVGTWPIGYVNACAMPTEHGVLVLLSEGLVSLIYQVGKVFVHSYDWLKIESDWTDPNRTLSEHLGWESYGWTVERTVDALTEIFHAYFRNGSVTTAPRQQLPRMSKRALQLAHIVHNAERFLVAHEYAHVLHEHCGPLVVYETPAGDLKDFFARSRQQELDADQLAASLQLASCDLTGKDDSSRLEANFRVAGITLLFACNLFHDVVANGKLGFATTSSPYIDHPPANERVKELLQFLRRFGPEFAVMGQIVTTWALPLSLMVGEQFHEQRERSGGTYPYLRGQYESPFETRNTGSPTKSD